MIFYLVKAGRPKYFTIDVFLSKVAPEANSFIKPLTYDEIFRSKKLFPGTYIFSDLERLNCFELEAAADIWTTLKKYQPDIRLLNHPLKAMRRFQLLRRLYISGLNDFNVYRLTELRKPRKFPVFIRGENDHYGSETELIFDQQQLDSEIEALITAGKTIESRIIVEVCAKHDSHGLYKKYSAFNISGTIIPRHLIFNDNWHVKNPDIVDEHTIKQSREYMHENPHAEQISRIFSIAKIDYGRIDYSIIDGKIQTYEINTNPRISGEITLDDIKIVAKLTFLPVFLSVMKSIDSEYKNKNIIKLSFGINPVEPFGGLNYRKSILERLALLCKYYRL